MPRWILSQRLPPLLPGTSCMAEKEGGGGGGEGEGCTTRSVTIETEIDDVRLALILQGGEE